MVFELDDEMWTIVCPKNVIDIDYKNNYIGTNVSKIKIMIKVNFCEGSKREGHCGDKYTMLGGVDIGHREICGICK